MNSGKKGTQRNQLRDLKNLIQRMVKESPDDSVLDEDVISVALTEMDISRQKIEDIIAQEVPYQDYMEVYSRHDRISLA